MRHLTGDQEDEAIKMSKFFPSIARGHGSQHRTTVDGLSQRCSSKDCHADGPRHHQSPTVAAERFILGRDL